MSKAPILLAGALACNVLWGPEALAARSQEPMVHEPGGSVGYTRTCANEKPYTVQAYSRMESKDGRAAALVRMVTGYAAPARSGIMVWADLVDLDIRAGKGWARVSFSLKLKAQAKGNKAVSGAPVTDYPASEPHEPPTQRDFVTTASGRARWLEFAENGDGNPDETYRISPFIAVPAAALGVSGPDTPIATALVVTNLKSGKKLFLHGPSLRIPKRVWKMKPPKFKAMGLLATLNPLAKGGLWQTLRHGFKYDHCIKERRSAKQRFAARPPGSPRSTDAARPDRPRR